MQCYIRVAVCPEESSNVTLCHEGQSLMDVINGKNKGKGAAFFQYYRSYWKVMGYGMKTKDYKYVRWTDFRYISIVIVKSHINVISKTRACGIIGDLDKFQLKHKTTLNIRSGDICYFWKFAAIAGYFASVCPWLTMILIS